MRSGRGLVPIAAATLAGVCAVAGVSAKDTWRKITSSNFTAIGNVADADLRGVVGHLEQFREAVHVMWPLVELSHALPTIVYVFRNDQSYTPFKPLYKGKPMAVAGYFTRLEDRNVITLQADVPDDGNSTVFHEYFHYLTAGNLRHAPVWLNEALAEVYSSFETTEGGRHVLIGKPVANRILYLRDRMGDQLLLPLKTLIHVNGASPEYHDSDKVHLFYSQSYALVHYLMFGGKKERSAALVKFVGKLADRDPTDADYEELFQPNLAAVDEELRNYILRQAYSYVDMSLSAPLAAAQGLSAVPLSDGEAALELGELALGVGRGEQAVPWLTTALAALPDKTRPKLGLAQVELSRHHIAEANRLLADVLAAAPDNLTAMVEYAETQCLSGAFTDGVRLYARAVQAHPDQAYLHAGLALAYAGAGQADRAASEVAEAARLRPDDSTSFNRLAWYYLTARQHVPAARAAEATIEIDRWQSEASIYMAISGYVAYRRASMEAEARGLLDRAVASGKRSWPFAAVQFLRGERSAADLLREAADNDKRTEARTYLALSLLLGGKIADATPHLTWVRDHGTKTFFEYFVALAELEALGPAKMQTRTSGVVSPPNGNPSCHFSAFLGARRPREAKLD